MASQLSRVPASQPVHVRYRDGHGARVFHHHRDHSYLYELLIEAAERHGCLVHAYALARWHVDVLLTPMAADSPARMVRHLEHFYGGYVDGRYRRAGASWRGCYRATPVEAGRYLLPCCRHIDLTPVRSGDATHPAWYPWSSYLCNAWGEPDPLIEPHERYYALGPTTTARQAAYRRLVNSRVDTVTQTAIERATERGEPLGSDAFGQAVAELRNAALAVEARLSQKAAGAGGNAGHAGPLPAARRHERLTSSEQAAPPRWRAA